MLKTSRTLVGLFSRGAQSASSDEDNLSEETEREAQAIERRSDISGITAADGTVQKLYQRFYQFGFVWMASWCQDRSREALEESIRLLRIAISLCPPSASDRDDILFTVGFVFNERYKICGSRDDLQKSISLLREAVELCPEERPVRSAILNNLANALNDRYACIGDIADLKDCIHWHWETLKLRPNGHPDRSGSLNNLANALNDQYARLGDIAELQYCIHLHREALELRPEGHPDRSSSLNNLAVALIDRYARLGDIADLKDCICLHQEALDLRPEGHPNRPSSLNNLANALSDRYDRLGDIADLERRIHLHREAFALHTEGHPNRYMSHNNLANALSARYARLGDIADLKECIQLHQEALRLCQDGHPNRSISLDNLANALSDRYERFGSIADHEECIRLHQEALALRPEGHPNRCMSLNNLANAFSRRYARIGKIEDLEQYIRLHQEALKLRPNGHPDRSLSLNNLAVALNARYTRFGDISNLEENIHLHLEALELHPEGHPDRSATLNNLAASLRNRYERLGDISDLEEHIRLYKEALSLHPKGHPDRAGSLNNLAVALGDRYEYTRLDIADLKNCICLHQEALELRPEGHPDRSGSLNNLALALGKRYESLGDISDLEEHIRLLQEALQLRLEGHPQFSGFLHNLGDAFSKRYMCFGIIADLEECIRLHKEALALCPDGHPHRSKSLVRLANAFSKRYARLGNIADIEVAVSHLRSGSTDVFSSQAIGLHCAFRWKEIAEEHHHDSLGEAFTTTAANVRRYIVIGPTTQLQYAALLRDTEISALPVDAAAYFIEKGNVGKAIEFLDEGRALLVSELRRYRKSLSLTDQQKIGENLSSRYLHLCEELRKLSNAEVRFETFSAEAKLESQSDGSEASSAQAVAYGQLLKRKREMMEEYNDLLTEVRALPGCEDFQSRPKFSDLQAAAKEGPIIIINCSRRRSDVIIVFADRSPLHVPLEKDFWLKILELYQSYPAEGLSGMADDDGFGNPVLSFSAVLRRVAETLWDLFVHTVVEKLKEAGIPKGSRIWWCPTSFLTSLPIHAAGKGDEFLVDHFVSSYTPTLSSLIDARRAYSATAPPSPRILVVAQTKSSGLESAGKEADKMIKLGPFVDLLDEQEATPASVVAKLPLHDWAHFICHGTVAEDPFESSLVLYKRGKLSLNDIMKAHLPDAKFAFLAACHTAELNRGRVLQDEVLHLAGAMQISGFRSVVGTMWQMVDEDGPRLAEIFYKEMLAGDDDDVERHTRAARSLWKPVQMMRKKRLPMARWANFVHIGA